MPRSKEQFQEMRENSKKIILNTALKLFSTNGFHATTINKIAKEAGIATGLVYNYFDSKEMLLDEIVRSSVGEFNAILYARTSEILKTNNLVALIEIMIDTIKSNITSWKLFVNIFLQSDVPIEKVPMNTFFSDLFQVALIYFQKKGVSSPEIEAKLLLELLHGAILTYIISEDDDTIEFVKNQLIKKFLL
jgi:AcrR family transcriptional regulator